MPGSSPDLPPAAREKVRRGDIAYKAASRIKQHEREGNPLETKEIQSVIEKAIEEATNGPGQNA